MDAKARGEKLGEVMTFLQDDCKGDLSIGDVCKLAEVMVGSTQSFFASLDSVIYSEFRELSSYIENAQHEIGALQANDLHQQRIPDAGKQLDAIVKSTEEATNRIMEQAEAIMCANPLDMEAYQETVNNAVMEIFEACSFQDLTGQRISKVVQTLKHIEERVGQFASAVKAKDVVTELSEDEATKAKRVSDQLLNGPQFDGEGVSQSMVDELLAGGSVDFASDTQETATHDTPEPAEAIATETSSPAMPEPAETVVAEIPVPEVPAPESPAELPPETVAAAEEVVHQIETAGVGASESPAAEQCSAEDDAAEKAAADNAAAEKAAAEKDAADNAAAEKAAAEKAAADNAAAEKAAAEKAAADNAAEEKAAAEKAAAEKAAAEKAAAEKAAADKAAAEKAAAEKAAAEKAAAPPPAPPAAPKPAPAPAAAADTGKENSQEDIDALFG